MKKHEYAIELSKDRGMSETEIANKSGLLKDVEFDDVPGILFSIGVLRDADEHFLEEVKKGLRQTDVS